MSIATVVNDSQGTDLAVTPMHMRKALGRFASGVTIVTTADNEDESTVHGMTANAFTSVSLDPPLVLVSISTRAKIDQRIRDTGRYGVSILACDQEPLSLHFAGAANRPDLVRFVWRNGVPLLEGALVHLACTVTDTYPAGDHTLHVGRVERLWYDNGHPLVFYTGSFRSLELLGHDEPWGF